MAASRITVSYCPWSGIPTAVTHCQICNQRKKSTSYNCTVEIRHGEYPRGKNWLISRDGSTVICGDCFDKFPIVDENNQLLLTI